MPVLLVDDSLVARCVLTRRLAAECFVVAERGSVAGARDVDATTLTCAIVDLELPDGDGEDVAAALARQNASLPIAFFTGGAAPETLEKARVRGPVFRKPDVERVIAWVKARGSPSPLRQPPPTK